MRSISPLLGALALSLSLSSAPTLAADDPVRAPAESLGVACRLLDMAELASVNFTLTGRPRGNSFTVKTDQSGAPDEMDADICFFYEGIEGGRISASVTVERFPAGRGMREWLLAKNQGAADGATLTSIGDAVCEQGHYSFANPQPEDRGSQREQRYIACDQITDSAHVTVGFEVPTDGRALPAPAEVKRLLDGVNRRLTTPAR